MKRLKLFSETWGKTIQVSPRLTLTRCKASEIFKALGRVIPPQADGYDYYYLVKRGEEIIGGVGIDESPGQCLSVSMVGGRGMEGKIQRYFEGLGYPRFSWRSEDSSSWGAASVSDPIFGRLWEITKDFSLHTDSPKEIKLKNNLVLKKAEYGWLAKLLGHIPAIRRSQERNVFYDITLDGEEVGEICFNEEKKAPDTVYIGWVGVDDDYRGRHYATETLKTILDFLKNQGYKKVTLEAVGSSSPDAHHIYQKLGFKDIKVIEEYGTGAWGGLIEMEKTFSVAYPNQRQRDALAKQIKNFRKGGYKSRGDVVISSKDWSRAHIYGEIPGVGKVSVPMKGATSQENQENFRRAVNDRFLQKIKSLRN